MSENIVEIICDNCGGSGKIKICHLCNNTGFIVDFSGSYYRLSECPNGCKKLEMRLSDKKVM
jgi:DnaJ-class molecular chaperone